MQSSPSSNSDSSNPQGRDGTRTVITVLTWAMRFIMGGVFIYSGFVKAVDPWGTFYKLEEYFAAMGIPCVDQLTLVFTFALFTAEFLIGVFLLLGCYRRSAPVAAAAFMAVMLPLTLWIAIKNPVADCGCFGDALVLSNWATFWKNVALTAVAVWLLIFNRRAGCVVTPALQWISFVVSALFLATIGVIGYLRQPLIDFRPYPEGCEIYPAEDTSDDPSFTFVYEKDGVRKEFSEDDALPDASSGWTFVERKEQAATYAPAESRAAEVKRLTVWDSTGEDDVTADVLGSEEDKLLLMIPDLDKVTAASTWKINSMKGWAEKHGIVMCAILDGSEEEIAAWEDISMPEYPIYTSDDTSIKEMVRGNPGVVYVHDGKIAWKSTLSALDADDFMSGDYSPMSFHYDAPRGLRNMTAIYLSVMGVLVLLSFTPGFLRRLLHGSSRYS